MSNKLVNYKIINYVIISLKTYGKMTMFNLILSER